MGTSIHICIILSEVQCSHSRVKRTFLTRKLNLFYCSVSRFAGCFGKSMIFGLHKSFLLLMKRERRHHTVRKGIMLKTKTVHMFVRPTFTYIHIRVTSVWSRALCSSSALQSSAIASLPLILFRFIFLFAYAYARTAGIPRPIVNFS